MGKLYNNQPFFIVFDNETIPSKVKTIKLVLFNNILIPIKKYVFPRLPLV